MPEVDRKTVLLYQIYVLICNDEYLHLGVDVGIFFYIWK